MEGVEITEAEVDFNIAKVFDSGERLEENDEILWEEARIRGELSEETFLPLAEELGDDLSEYESGEECSNGEGGETGHNNTTGSSPSGTAHKRQPRKGLSPHQKIHAIAVHCTASPQRRKIMGEYIRAFCTIVLAVIKSMVIRWNTVLAELRRALQLRPAFDHWVNTLDTGKTGKARRVAQKQKRMWALSDREWIITEELVHILEPFKQTTLSFSQKGKAQLPHLKKKLEKYFEIALKSDLTLAASILHPGMRLQYFEDRLLWGDTMDRGQNLLKKLFESYKLESDKVRSEPPQSSHLRLKQTWSNRLLKLATTSTSTALDDELSRFFGNVYAFQPGTNILQWWKEHEHDFPILSRNAQDYLGIPATSVSVERLFSKCKLVMSDYRMMGIETARCLIACKH
ncbi:hAT family dimerization protein [Ceratobasidium sp. AG-Ba]|nr:hAT family dimerization protein [Ceratobasidium sp. AG-Ba]QRW07793.1 hAT family dimerization protein [Ceratobasidium sp. AG-Ba]